MVAPEAGGRAIRLAPTSHLQLSDGTLPLRGDGTLPFRGDGTLPLASDGTLPLASDGTHSLRVIGYVVMPAGHRVGNG